MSLSRKIGNIGSILDSASTGTFMSKAASDAAFESISYSSLSGTPTVLDSANVTAIIDSAYVQARQTLGSVVLDSAAIISVIDSNYVQARTTTVSSGFVDYEYTATSGQTTFQDSDLNSNILSYTTDGIMVFYNGVLLRDSSDYTASDGSSVVLASGADSGSTVSISKWTIPSAGGGAAGIAWGGDRAIVFNDPYSTKVIDYFDITTTGNAASFGNYSSSAGRNVGLSDTTYGVCAGNYEIVDIEYITIATTGNTSDFGDLTIGRRNMSSVADGTYGIFSGGNGNNTDVIDYITVASPGNATDFGDLSAISYSGQGVNDATRGVISLGYNSSLNTFVNTIEYITMATPSNSTDFGDLTQGKCQGGGTGCDDGTYGIFVAGIDNSISSLNEIEYIIVQTTGNATDFGDLLSAISFCASTSNDTRGVINGGTSPNSNVIQYITMATPSNATDFGDLTVASSQIGATSGSPS